MSETRSLANFTGSSVFSTCYRVTGQAVALFIYSEPFQELPIGNALEFDPGVNSVDFLMTIWAKIRVKPGVTVQNRAFSATRSLTKYPSQEAPALDFATSVSSVSTFERMSV